MATPPTPQPTPVQPLGQYLSNGIVNFLELSIGNWRSTLLGLCVGSTAVILAIQTGIHSGLGRLGIALGVVAAVQGLLSSDTPQLKH